MTLRNPGELAIHPLLYDVLSGHFTVAGGSSRTLGRLLVATYIIGEKADIGDRTMTFTRRIDWAPGVLATVRCVDVNGLRMPVSILVAETTLYPPSFTVSTDHTSSNPQASLLRPDGITKDYPLQLGASLGEGKLAITQTAETFFHDMTQPS